MPTVEHAGTADEKAANTFYKVIAEHKDVLKMVSAIQTVMVTVKPIITKALAKFADYTWIWTSSKPKAVEVMALTNCSRYFFQNGQVDY